MLTYALIKTKKHPLYEELYRCIRDDILSGKITKKTRLPSKRGLADHLGISIVTVQNAYAQLEAEGYISSVMRKGYFVSPDIMVLPQSSRKKTADPSEKSPSCFRADLINNLPSEQFPFSVWAKIMRSVILEQENRFMEFIPHQGTFELRKALSDYLYESRNMSVPQSAIVIGAGAEYLYQMLVMLLGRSRMYAIEDPGYKKIAKIYDMCGAPYCSVPLDSSGMSASCLKESGADIAHISPAHHYPTGIVMPISRRQEIISWAEKDRKRYIIEDDYDSEIRFNGKPLPPMYEPSDGGKVIYINTFTQTISPSLRISYMCLPPSLMENYRKMFSSYSCTVSYFDQLTLAKFISEGYFEKHISRLKNYYRKKRADIIKMVSDPDVSGLVKIREENAGLHFVAELKTAKSDEAIKMEAAERKIRLAFVSDYLSDPRSKDQHRLVINYAGVDTEIFPSVLNDICSIL